MKLLDNQVIVKNEETGEKFVYEITDPEDLALIERRGRKDEDGNIILTYPFLSVLRRFTIESVLNDVDKYMEEDIKVQSIKEPKKREELLDIGNFSECSNNELSELLSFYGAFLSYISIRLSKIDSKRGVIKSSIEEANSKAMYLLQNDNDEKRKTKEVLNGEILTKYPQIKKMKQDLIETEAIFIRIKALFDSYQILWNTVSRIISLRAFDLKN